MDSGIRPLTDRRGAIRTRAIASLGIIQARVRPGHEASVIDISPHGALIETALRLLPGRHIELQLERANHVMPIRGRVVRCRVVRVLPSQIVFHGAIGFEQPLAWVVVGERTEYPVLATPGVERGR
jgi:PilZ domain-containing protein